MAAESYRNRSSGRLKVARGLFTFTMADCEEHVKGSFDHAHMGLDGLNQWIAGSKLHSISPRSAPGVSPQVGARRCSCHTSCPPSAPQLRWLRPPKGVTKPWLTTGNGLGSGAMSLEQERSCLTKEKHGNK